MPRTLSATLVQNKNAVVSADPFVWAFEISAFLFPAPIRFVSDVQAVTYQGNSYLPFPVDVSSIGENVIGERQRVQGIVANVDQQVITLLNQYWDAVSDPLWTVSIWQILRSNPDEVPVSDAEIFEVLSAETDLLQVTFDLEMVGIPSRARSTGRRFTTTGGFPSLPRVGRFT